MSSKKYGENNQSRGAPGFTIVELLIAVSIIAILAGLLTPVITGVRGRSHQVTCVSNLRQIGLALSLYSAEHQEVRPRTFQALWDSGYIRSEQLIKCQNDWTSNWGGIWHDTQRNTNEMPETITYSYMHQLSTPDWEWNYLRSTAGSSAGIMACQLHGFKTEFKGAGANPLHYEGLILRLQLDGAVVRRRTAWLRGTDGHMQADAWRFFADIPRP